MSLYSTFFAGICLFSAFVAPVHSADTEITQRLERIERLLQSQGLLDMLQQIEALQQELSNLHGEIEFQNHTLEQLKKRQRDLYTDVDQRLQSLERGGLVTGDTTLDTVVTENPDDSAPPLQTLEPIATDMSVSTASPQAETPLMVEVIENRQNTAALEPPVAPPPVASTADTGEATLTPMETMTALDPVQIRAQYQQAFKLLKQSQYDQAIKAFRAFLLVNPQSEFSDNAQYWLGEAYYVTRQFEQALVEYDNLLKHYPDSKKVTHSLLKMGFCYYELGQIDEAVSRLEALRQEYPGTTAARLAEERLKKIAQAAAQETTTTN